MRKIMLIVVIGVILLIASISFQNTNLEKKSYEKYGNLKFHNSIDSGKKEAKNNSKDIFVYFRSDTCSWCLLFEKEALSDNNITDILKKNFVLIAIDTTTQKQTTFKFGVKGTPYMIFFRKDGEEILRIPGYVPKDVFLKKIKEIIEKP